MSEDLPEGWKLTTLGEIADYVNGRPFKPSEWSKTGLPIIRIQNLTRSTDVVNKFNGEYEKRYFVEDGDLLLAWSATLDIFEWTFGPALLNQHIFNVKVKPGVEKRFFFYLIKYYLDLIKSQTHGTGMTHITKPKLEATQVVIPPLQTQQKIVAKLDAFFEHYNELKKQHELEKKRVEKIMQTAINKLIPNPENMELPEGWKIGKLSEVCILNPSKKELVNLAEELLVSFVPMKCVSDITQEILNPETKKLKEVKNGYTYFRNGDIIFAKITPCMENGKVAIAKTLENGIGFGSTEFHVIRSKNSLETDIIFYILSNPSFREKAKMNMTGTSGHLRVPVEFLENTELPIPPIATQRGITVKLNLINQEALLIKKELERKERALEVLPNVVLRKAFDGELAS